MGAAALPLDRLRVGPLLPQGLRTCGPVAVISCRQESRISDIAPTSIVAAMGYGVGIPKSMTARKIPTGIVTARANPARQPHVVSLALVLS